MKYYTNDCVCVCGNVNLWAKVTHESHKHWSPTNNDNDDSTVTQREEIGPYRVLVT